MGSNYFLILVGESDTEVSDMYIVVAEGVSEALSKFDSCFDKVYKKYQISKLSKLSFIEKLNKNLLKPFSREDIFVLMP